MTSDCFENYDGYAGHVPYGPVNKYREEWRGGGLGQSI